MLTQASPCEERGGKAVIPHGVEQHLDADCELDKCERMAGLNSDIMSWNRGRNAKEEKEEVKKE